MKLRKAKIADVEEMMALINSNAEIGLMLPRSRNMLYENIREFMLAEEDGEIIGVASLHILWSDLGEIRALAVAPAGRDALGGSGDRGPVPGAFGAGACATDCWRPLVSD